MVIGSRRARPDGATVAATATAVLMVLALAMIFFYVPTDVDQGYSQRIFYFHVPIALTTYTLFVWGAVNAARYLWRRDQSLDLKSYVPMHLGVIFGSLTLATGSLWANISWGTHPSYHDRSSSTACAERARLWTQRTTSSSYRRMCANTRGFEVISAS